MPTTNIYPSTPSPAQYTPPLPPRHGLLLTPRNGDGSKLVMENPENNNNTRLGTRHANTVSTAGRIDRRLPS